MEYFVNKRFLIVMLSLIVLLSCTGADTHYNRGNAYYDKGDYARAISAYTQAIRIDPNDAKVYYNRGIAYADKKDYEKAITDFDQVLMIDTNKYEAYNNRGLAYYNKGDYDRAIADYTQAIKIAPDYAEAYNNRGFAYAHKVDYDRAIADYTQAIGINPYNAAAHHNRGVAYDDKGDNISAFADFRKALELDPDYAKTYNNMGYDNILWGASVDDVRKAYNLGENFVLKGDNDTNIARITVHYNNSSITKKEFLFNKWGDGKYKLYGVWVTYADEKESNNNGQSLMNMLTATYGSVTRTYKNNPQISGQSLFGASSAIREVTHYIFNKYSPNITVELINTDVYANAIIFGMYQESRRYSNQVCYTWTKFRDSYMATQKPKLEL
jgi:tetratricopeptide (TPR) repeat protein